LTIDWSWEPVLAAECPPLAERDHRAAYTAGGLENTYGRRRRKFKSEFGGNNSVVDLGND